MGMRALLLAGLSIDLMLSFMGWALITMFLDFTVQEVRHWWVGVSGQISCVS